MEKNKIKIVDLFSGIGGFRHALSNLGIDNNFDVEVVGWSEIDKQAKQAYKSLYKPDENGEIEMGDIVDFNDNRINELDDKEIDMVCGGFPCFVAGTPVLTKNGYKPIEDVEIGEYVLTTDRTFHQVENTMVKQADTIVYMKAQGMFEELKGTPNHPIYAMRRIGPEKYEEPRYIPLCELQKDDKIAYPLINGKDSSYTYDFWKLVGMYLANGWTMNNSYTHKVIICGGESKREKMKECITKAGFHYTEVKDGPNYKMHIANKFLCEFLENFGKHTYEKHLTPQCFELIDEYKSALIEGWLNDGCVDTKNKVEYITTTSLELVLGMSQIARDAYRVPVSIKKHIPNRTCVIDGRVVNERQTYTMTIPKYKMVSVEKNGYIWCPIKSIYVEDETNEVYNLSVGGDPSYTVYGMCVHNCQSFSVLGNRLGFNDPKGRGLMFFQIMRLLEHRKNINKEVPFVLLENVRNLMMHDGGNTFKTIKESLESLGYKVYADVFQALNMKVPQSRRRVAIFATTLDLPENFQYDANTIEQAYNESLKPGMHVVSGATAIDLLDKEVDKKYFVSDSFKEYVLHKISPRVPCLKGLNPLFSQTLTVSQSLRACCESYYSKDFLDNPEAWGTWEDHTYEEMLKQPIRRLTPFEKMRLQGFEDYMTQRLIDGGCSDSNIYKRAGNAVCVSVFYGLFKWLLIDNKLIEQLGNKKGSEN